MEANIITLLFKETMVGEKIVETNVDINLALPMLKVLDNCLQLTHAPPSTSVEPLGTVHKFHA
jgi:hypothetical protein